MTIKSEIMEMLRNGVPLAEIRMKFRSKSTLYECLAEFLAELTEKVEEIKTALQQEETKLQETKTTREELTIERNGLKNDVEGLKAEKESLANEVKSLLKEHDELLSDAAELEARGFTSEIVAKLKTAYDKDGTAVDALLETHEKASVLRKEVASLKQIKTGLTGKVGFLDGKKQKVEKKLVSLQNRLDLLKAEVAAFQDVTDVLTVAIKDGYKPQELKAVLFWLRKMEIENARAQSISHLLQCIAEAKKLLNLRHEVSLAENRLAELTKVEAELRVKVDVLLDVVLKGIEDAKTKGEQAIASIGTQSRDAVVRVALESEAKIKNILDIAGTATVNSIGVATKLQEQKTKLEILLQPAQALMGVLNSNDDLKAVQPSLVVALIERLVLYCEQRYPNALINAYYNVATNELVVNPSVLSPIMISNLLRLAAEGIRKRIVQEEHEKQSH
jgi:chromosome segregation ATPase